MTEKAKSEEVCKAASNMTRQQHMVMANVLDTLSSDPHASNVNYAVHLVNTDETPFPKSMTSNIGMVIFYIIPVDAAAWPLQLVAYDSDDVDIRLWQLPESGFDTLRGIDTVRWSDRYIEDACARAVSNIVSKWMASPWRVTAWRKGRCVIRWMAEQEGVVVKQFEPIKGWAGLRRRKEKRIESWRQLEKILQ